MIRAIAIDDEANSLSILQLLIEKYCPNINLIATTTTPKEGVAIINQAQPDLVFLDISMPGMDGFELLELVDYQEFEVIFITAHDDYALQAFQVGAIHYLLKPIDHSELITAINRVQNKLKQHQVVDVNQLLQKLATYRKPKIAIPTTRGIEMIDVDDIVHCEASSNYTVVYFQTTKKIVTKTLKEIEQQLKPYNFMRVHHSFLINIAHLKNYVKVEGGFVTMSNGSQVSVSRSRKQELLDLLSEME